MCVVELQMIVLKDYNEIIIFRLAFDSSIGNCSKTNGTLEIITINS